MGGESHDTVAISLLAKLARGTRNIFAIGGRANDDLIALSRLKVARAIRGENGDYRRNPQGFQFVSVLKVIRRQVNRKPALIGRFDSLTIGRRVFRILFV
jgi:hypothetical protein